MKIIVKDFDDEFVDSREFEKKFEQLYSISDANSQIFS
jgi:hypothetical protein